MMRVKALSTIKYDNDRKAIADFLSLNYDDIIPHESPTTFIVDIKNNKVAQDAYKERNPFGNGHLPKTFNFDEPILVRWQENKLQAM